jgi:phenylpropionate dioxygenase-like ring-hydroxylating dioxygenase large terminal subunit
MSHDWPKAVANGWHPIMEAKALKDKVVSKTLMGMPIMLYRAKGLPVIMVDKCPHRALPLSKGCVKDDLIACPYHGWRFNAEGECVDVPGSNEIPSAHVRILPLEIRAGLIWTSLAEVPGAFPTLPAILEDQTLDHFCWVVKPTRMRLLDALENMLDASHPHYVHPWFLRSETKRREMRVDVSLGPDGAEAIYYENAKASGLMPQLFEGTRTVSIGRYFPPNVGQLAFETEKGLSVSLTAILTPVDHNLTQPFALFSTRRAIAPAWLKKWVLKGFNYPLLKQDQHMLKHQVDTLEKTGAVEFTVGPMDLIGPTIWRLANQKPQPENKFSKTLYL